MSALAAQRHAATVSTHVPDCAASRDPYGTLVIVVVALVSLPATSAPTAAAHWLLVAGCVLHLGCDVTTRPRHRHLLDLSLIHI